MSRVQLALNVSNLDDAVAFYSKLFRTEPAKLRPGYANFAVDEPPLKLVLIEGSGEPGHAEPPGRRGREHAGGRRRAGAPRRRRARDGDRGRRSSVASRCRTRCGSTGRMRSHGRSTPCSLTPRCRPVSCGAAEPGRGCDVLRERAGVRGALLLTVGHQRPAARHVERSRPPRHRRGGWAPRSSSRSWSVPASTPSACRRTTSGCSCSRTRSRPAPVWSR